MSPVAGYQVDLPAGGKLSLQSVEEVDLWDDAIHRYQQDYSFDKLNERVLLGALVTQHLNLFRSQQATVGMMLDPNGNWVRKPKMGYQEQAAARKAVRETAEEIRELEKALGIDKKTRDAGGGQSIQDYIVSLKRAGRAYGIHVNERVQRIEALFMDLKTRFRMLDNLDDEDKAHHGISEESVMNQVRDAIQEIEDLDKQFAKDQGHLWKGKL